MATARENRGEMGKKARDVSETPDEQNRTKNAAYAVSEAAGHGCLRSVAHSAADPARAGTRASTPIRLSQKTHLNFQ